MAFRDLCKVERARDLADHALVRRVAVGVHEDDRDQLVALRPCFCERAAHGLRIRSGLDGSVRQHPFVDLDHVGI